MSCIFTKATQSMELTGITILVCGQVTVASMSPSPQQNGCLLGQTQELGWKSSKSPKETNKRMLLHWLEISEGFGTGPQEFTS